MADRRAGARFLGTVPAQFGNRGRLSIGASSRFFKIAAMVVAPSKMSRVDRAMQNAVGEYVSAFGVGGKLHFVNRDKIHLTADRHGFGCANEKRAFGGTIFLRR
ncbi:MAG: hypothetical protein CM15mP55_3040 [Hyphomicrobiales bacterium]|nr:MAG: hypothetical protein CM15mP55_3040 [Hyphomicrobiales bacterium]